MAGTGKGGVGGVVTQVRGAGVGVLAFSRNPAFIFGLFGGRAPERVPVAEEMAGWPQLAPSFSLYSQWRFITHTVCIPLILLIH